MNSEPIIPQPPPSRIERWAQGALLLVLAVYTALFLYHAARLIVYPYTIDYGEGFILNHANELAHFHNPYRSIESPPWLVVNYPPVYPAAVAFGIDFFGLQFHFGRFLSLAGAVMAGVCLYRMTRYQTSDRFAAWVAALMWMTAYPVYNWGTHHRVDSFGLGLEAAGLLLLLGRNHLKASAVFFLLALFTRQTLWVGPVAGYFYLRRYNGPREAAKWFGGLLLAGGLLFAALTGLTGGEFYRHIISHNANEFHWKDVWVMLHNAVMQMMKVQMAFYLYYVLRAAATKQWDLAAICVPMSFLTFLLVGKVGSATNYLFELAFVAAWTTGLVLAEAREILAKGSAHRIFIPVVLCLGSIFPVHIPHLYGEWKIFDWGGTPGRESGDLTASLVARLESIPEPVFSQDAGLSLLSGHKLVYDPFIMRQLSQQGRVDLTPFHKMLSDRVFTAIVLPFDLTGNPDAWKDEGWWSQFSEETARLIDRGYRVEPPGAVDPRAADPRMRGYYSPFGTNYLYLRKG